PAEPCTSPLDLAGLTDGAHTLKVTAVDPLDHQDPTPAERTFTVDAVAPTTTITNGPAALTDETTPTFGFTASEPRVTFQCAIDSPTLTDCPEPFTVGAALADGAHTFRVRATDAAGNVEGTVQRRDFTVDTSVPDTSITAGPLERTADPTPRF